MKTSYKALLMVAVMLATSVIAFADIGESTRSSLEFDDAAKTTVVGTLSPVGDLWTLVTPSQTYIIQMGNRVYRDSLDIDLQEDKEVAVFGYAHGGAITPILIVSDGTAYYFRDTDGVPLWINPRIRPAA